MTKQFQEYLRIKSAHVMLMCCFTKNPIVSKNISKCQVHFLILLNNEIKNLKKKKNSKIKKKKSLELSILLQILFSSIR